MEELNRAYLDALSGDIAGKKADLLQAQMAELHPADIAEILDKLEDGEVQYLWNLIQTEDRGDVLVELEEDVRVASAWPSCPTVKSLKRSWSTLTRTMQPMWCLSFQKSGPQR